MNNHAAVNVALRALDLPLLPGGSVPECPSWCTASPGHAYESESPDGHPARSHEIALGGSRTGALITVEGVLSDEVETLAAPVVNVVIGGDAHDNEIWDVAEVGALGQALLDAVSRVEMLSAPDRGRAL